MHFASLKSIFIYIYFLYIDIIYIIVQNTSKNLILQSVLSRKNIHNIYIKSPQHSKKEYSRNIETEFGKKIRANLEQRSRKIFSSFNSRKHTVLNDCEFKSILGFIVIIGRISTGIFL